MFFAAKIRTIGRRCANEVNSTIARKPRTIATGQKSVSAMQIGAERLRAFQESGLTCSPLNRNDAELLAGRLNLTSRHVRTLFQTFLNTPTAEALAPRARGRKAGSHLLSDDLRTAVIDKAKRHLAVQSPPSIRAAALEIRSELIEQMGHLDAELPTVRQITAIIANLPPTFFRSAKSAQHKTALEPHYSGIVAERPLDAVQMDHTPINVMLVDAEDRSPIGRAMVTFVIDICTRAVLGFYLGYEGESIFRCGKAVANAILPKEPLLRALGIGDGFEYPMHGVFDRFYVDWASAHRSSQLRAVLLYAGVCDPDARGKGGAHLGGHVERLIGTMMGKCHFLPGRTGRNTRDRGDYDPQTEACMTLREAERWLYHQIGIYHETPHAGLGGVPPLLKWRMETERQPVTSFRGDPVHLAKLCLPHEARTVRSGGIKLGYQRYAAPILDKHIGLNVFVHFAPADAGEIYALIGGEFHTLTCQTRLPFEGVSFAELKARRQKMSARVQTYFDEEGAQREQFHRVAARAEVDAAKRRHRARKREEGTSIVHLLAVPKSETKGNAANSFVRPDELTGLWDVANRHQKAGTTSNE